MPFSRKYGAPFFLFLFATKKGGWREAVNYVWAVSGGREKSGGALFLVPFPSIPLQSFVERAQQTMPNVLLAMAPREGNLHKVNSHCTV